MLRNLVARTGQSLVHFTEDVRTTGLCLFERLLHDFLRDAGNLDVHLHRGDAGFRTCNLEIHVAEVIFVAQNVGQNGKIIAFEDQAHRDAAHRTFDRNAGIHHGEAAAADRCHRARAVGLGNVGQHADGVREIVMGRQHVVQRTPGKLAMAGIAARRGTETTDFTDRIRREVVVQHEAFVRQAFETVDHLLAVLGAKGGRAQRLRFTAGE